MPINFDDLVAGGAGAVDEALFGVPEWLAKQVNRKGVEDYIKKHEKAYKTGEMVGTVGSMFIPIPGLGAVKAAKLGKGALTAAKGLKAADTAMDLAKLGKLAKGADTAADVAKLASGAKKSVDLGNLALRGAASGALESGVRGITSEKTPEQIIKDIQTGAAFGAGGGVVGGVLSKNLPRIMGQATEGAEKAYLGSTDLTRRQALGYLKDVAGPGAKGFGKFKTVDGAREELVRVGKEIGAHIPGKMDEAIKKNADQWRMIDDVVESTMPNVRASDLYTNAAKKLDFDALTKEFPADEVEAFVRQVMEEGVPRSGVANARQFLSDLIEASYNKSTIKNAKDVGTQRMQRKIASILKAGVDEELMDMAKKAGVDIDFAKLKKDYLPMRAFAESAAVSDIAPNRSNLGSPTFEKLAASGALGSLGLGGAGSAIGLTQGEDMSERLKNAALGGVIGFGAKKGAESLLTRGKAATLPIAKFAQKAVEEASPEALQKMGAQVGGEAASVIAKEAIGEAAPTNEQEQNAAETGADAGEGKPQYIDKIMAKMQEYAAEQGVDPESEEFTNFAGQVYQLTDGFSPDKIGAILYQDPAEQAAYTKALTVSRKLKETLPGTLGERQGWFNGGTAEQTIEKNAAIDQLAALVGDVAKEKGSEAAAKKTLGKILSSNESAERKSQLVRTLLSSYGVDIDELEQMGVS